MGYVIDNAQPGDLPPKVEGRHRWVANVMFNLPDPSTFWLPVRTRLAGDNVVTVAAGCWDCEQPLTPTTNPNSHCPVKGMDL